MDKLTEITNKIHEMGIIASYCRFNPYALELEHAMAEDIAYTAGVTIMEVLEFVKRICAQTRYTYEECIHYARQYFVSGDYKIYSPDKYSLLVSQDYLFVIPSKDNEPTKLIKMA